MMDFIVDNDSNNYLSNKADCKSCVIAQTAEVSLSIIVKIYNKSPELFAASVMLVKIIDIDESSGELLSVQQLRIMQTQTSLVGTLLPSFNQNLKKDISNSFIEFFRLNEITIGDSYIFLGVVLNE